MPCAFTPALDPLCTRPDRLHGGATLGSIADEATSRGRTALFDDGKEEVITWMRIAEFQLVVLQQIAARLLHCAAACFRMSFCAIC